MEMEIKFKCNDLESVKERAVRLGFSLKRSEHQRDTYYIVNRKSKEGTRDYLRIREDLLNGELSLDYHRVISLLETDETEARIYDFGSMKSILNSLGYKIECIVDKQRECYSMGSASIVFDKVVGLGNFVEIEINGEPTEENKHILEEIVGKLGMNEKDRIIKKGYPDLLLESRMK